ncbi:MAG: putative carboxypeptidase [Ilumatobacteraceae bacterium]|nr:putative carboxypeptidase [Ilumatobacteraceae bacterium]
MIDLDAMLADLGTLVNIESPSNDLDALQASANALADVIEQRLGSRPQLVDSPGGPHVHWRADASSRVLILGHHDTVFPLGSLAARPFTVADGRITGPGVFDMKGGIVQAIHAIASLDDRSGVEMLFSADEEVGSGSSRSLIEQRAAACGAVLVVEPSGDGGALKTARKGTGGFEIVVNGRASHAGLEPEKGINSLVAAAELISRIATFGNDQFGTTVTPTMARSGTAENVVPAQTRLYVDVRVVEPDEKARIEALMAGLTTSVPGAVIEVSGGIGRPPMHPSASEQLYPLAVDAAARAGLSAVTGVAVGGGSDGNFTAAIGVPTLDGLGAVGGGAHADHEFVMVDTMVDRASLIAALVASIS